MNFATGISEDEIQEQLDKEEAATQRASGSPPLHKTSASAFLSMGLELEESQYVQTPFFRHGWLTDLPDRRLLKVFAAEQAGIPKSLQTTALRDQRKILKERIQHWEAVRAVYMPGLLQIQTDLGANPTALWSSNPNPEDVDLYLPSAIPSNCRSSACIQNLPEMELRLRTAQCSTSLQGLRQTLRVKTRMVYFKNKNIRGQREGTRSRSIIDRVHKRAIRFVQKYRAARRAKLNLEGPGDWELTYQELRNDDIRGFASAKPKKKGVRHGIWEDGHAPPEPEEPELLGDETESDPDLNDGTEAGPPPKKKRKKGTGETRKELSWIWQTTALTFSSNEDDDILRAEWAKSRARVRRATEEVMLLREEMRRVLQFLEWRAKSWDAKANLRSKIDLEMNEGLKAYALQQAALQRSLATLFKTLWTTPLADVDELLESLGNPIPDADGEGADEDEDGEDDDNNGGTPIVST